MVDIFGNNIIDAYTSGNPVSKIYSLGTLVWERSTPPTPTGIKAIKFTCVDEPSTSGGKLGFIVDTTGQTLYWFPNLEWSRDGETWYDWEHNSSGVYDYIYVRENQSVYVRGYCQYTGLDSMNYGHFTMTSASGSFNCEGNIMHLLNYEQDLTVISRNYCFYGLFYNCTGLIDASGLILPATTLTQYCYGEMFGGCRYMVSAPELPAYTLVDYCYYRMFESCKKLTEIRSYNFNTTYVHCLDYILVNASSTGTIYTRGYSTWSVARTNEYIPSGWTITTITS